MPCTADFHHHIADPRFPQPDGFFEHTAAFATAVDMFDAHAPSSKLSIPSFLRSRQLVAARLLRRLEDVYTVQRKRLKTQVLQQLTPGRQRIRRGVGDALVRDTARMRLTQEENAQGLIDQQEVFQHVPVFLAARTRFLFSRVMGARNGSLGTVVTKRGAAAGGRAWIVSAGEASTGTGRHAPPSCSRRASTWRQGASPKVRSVLRNTGNRT
jgi:hypothetical protein